MPGWSQNPFWDEDPEELEQAGLSATSSPSVKPKTVAGEKKKAPAKKKTSATVPKKRKCDADSDSAPPKNPKPSTSSAVDIFASDTEAEEDDIIITCKQPREHEVQFVQLKPVRAATLKSFLSQRGSSGYTTQRDPARSGEFYIELRVYNSQEAEQIPCDVRWRKALLTLKTCTDTDSALWKSVSDLVKEAKQEFKKIQPIMYPNDQC